MLTERYEGKRYNSPNDVVVDPQGRIWFTDPLYAPDRSIMEHEHEAVYRIDTDGKVTRVITQPAIGRPNGLAITPDGKTLYVIDSTTSAPAATARSGPSTFCDDGSVAKQRVVLRFRPRPRRRRHAARHARQSLGRRRHRRPAHARTNRPTCRPASMSFRRKASCSAAFRSPKT